MQELPAILKWERDAESHLTSVSPEVEDILGYTPQQIINLEQRHHTLAISSAEGFEKVFQEEKERGGETTARMFKADLVHRNGGIVPAALLMIFVREGGRYVGMRSYGCPLQGWQPLRECCQEVVNRLVGAVAGEERELVRRAAA